MEAQKTLKSQSNLDKENETGGINLPAFRIYYKATVIKIPCPWHKDRDRDQRNKIKILERKIKVTVEEMPILLNTKQRKKKNYRKRG